MTKMQKDYYKHKVLIDSIRNELESKGSVILSLKRLNYEGIFPVRLPYYIAVLKYGRFKVGEMLSSDEDLIIYLKRYITIGIKSTIELNHNFINLQVSLT